MGLQSSRYGVGIGPLHSGTGTVALLVWES